MIHVLATVEAVDGKRDELLAHMRELLPAVHAEEGCIEYGPTVDVATNIAAQGDARPNVVTVIEKWRDLHALEQHLVAPHMMEYRSRVKDLVRQVTLQVVAPA